MAWSALEPEKQQKLEAALSDHERANPQPKITNMEGREVGDEYVPKIQGTDLGKEAPRASEEPVAVDAEA